MFLNLMIVFIVSGLWHGANWTFVVWGALHGLFMVIGLWTKNIRNTGLARLNIWDKPRLMLRLNVFSTFHLVVFAWIFFRANSLSDAFVVIQNMFRLTQVELITVGLLLTLIFMIGGLSPLHVHRSVETYFQTKSPQLRWAFYTVMALLIINLGVSNEVPFIYFQF